MGPGILSQVRLPPSIGCWAQATPTFLLTPPVPNLQLVDRHRGDARVGAIDEGLEQGGIILEPVEQHDANTVGAGQEEPCIVPPEPCPQGILNGKRGKVHLSGWRLHAPEHLREH